MVTILLANGFEVAEALVTLDLLHRAGVEACLTGLHSGEVLSANGIHVKMDRVLPEVGEEAFLSDLEMLILAGGMDNTIELTCSAQAKRVIAGAVDKGCKVAAICAAPVILAGMGLLDGRKAVCYPGMEGSMGAADVQVGSKVVVDGNFITGQGPGAAFDFALKLVEVLKGAEAARQVCHAVHYHG